MGKKIYLGYNAIKLNQICGLVFVHKKSAKYSTHYFNK